MSPTKELILDCLAARERLGEQLWTFDVRNAKALEDLARLKLIVLMSGNVEHTYRAYLTDTGREHTISPTYLSPLEQRVIDLQGRVSALRTELGIGGAA
jgi:hypothetical protein